MCSAPSPPKAPKIKQPEFDPSASLQQLRQDPKFEAAMKSRDITSLDSDSDVREIREEMIRMTYASETKGESQAARAFRQAIKLGIKDGTFDDDDINTADELDRAYEAYNTFQTDRSERINAENSAKSEAEWLETTAAQQKAFTEENRKYQEKYQKQQDRKQAKYQAEQEAKQIAYRDEQRAYDEQYQADQLAASQAAAEETRAYNEKYQAKQLKKQQKYNKRQNKKATNFAKKQTARQLKSTEALAQQQMDMQISMDEANRTFAAEQAAGQLEMTERMNTQNQEFQQAQADAMAAQQDEMRQLMEDMANQPAYQPKQAALPQIQAPAQKFVNQPPAPTVTPVTSPNPAPPPELVPTSDNGMGIIRQQASQRTRTRRASRGTSNLKVTR